ncbi:MAG: DHHA1 domain-containing protein, partial [Agathobaculum sp.]
DHVEQAGSYTAADHIRFDFTHFAALTADELQQVEMLVNEAILAGDRVITEEMSIEDAKKKGAMALFGEKYGSTVRVVQAGDSIELCGGTHLDNTAKAGMFKIISEASVAAGVRRVEALTGKGVLRFLSERQRLIMDTAAALKTSPNELLGRVEQTMSDLREMSKKIEKLNGKLASMQMVDLLNVSRDIKGVNVIATKLEDATPDVLRTMGDDIKAKAPNMVAVLSSVNGEKISLLCVCGAEAVKKGAHAGKIIKEVAKIVGGGGGGRPDSATAGGKDPSKLEEALEAVNNIVDAQL